MHQRNLMCFARGRGDDWEAICIDLDIAVQGVSFDEVKDTLNEAVLTYVEDAIKEGPEVAKKLLNRRAPLYVRIRHSMSYFFHFLFRRRNGGNDLRAGFEIPCHA